MSSSPVFNPVGIGIFEVLMSKNPFYPESGFAFLNPTLFGCQFDTVNIVDGYGYCMNDMDGFGA